MKLRALAWVIVIASFFVVAGLRAEDKTKSTAAKQFDVLKKLAGDWVEIGKDGKPTDKVVSSIRLTAAGSVIHETLFPGTDHEMVTMYHLDGADLVLTHYCVLGNQPRMRAEPGKDANEIVFKFAGGGNMKSPNDNHMDHATITVVDDAQIRAEWVACKDGEACHTAKFELARKAK